MPRSAETTPWSSRADSKRSRLRPAAVRLMRGAKIRIGALMINSSGLGDLVAVDRAVLVIREQRQVECDLARIADLDLMRLLAAVVPVPAEVPSGTAPYHPVRAMDRHDVLGNGYSTLLIL
jgi:hypothetical protein